MDREGRYTRREVLAAAAATGGVGVLPAGAAAADVHPSRIDGWLDSRADFGARGDGAMDDTRRLQAAIHAGAAEQRPVVLPPGVYRTTEPLLLPPNAVLLGGSPGMGFGCRIEPDSCPAFVVGGATPSFHCVVADLMIWPKGRAPKFIISVDNSYSITFRNVRIHEAQGELAVAAIALLGAGSQGGHGPSLCVTWDNLVVRNDSVQPRTAILAAAGCGTHRFIAPDLENYQVLLDWQGGQLDIVAPYAERAGKYGVDCNPHPTDPEARLSLHGGHLDVGASAVGCAVRETTRNLHSFGTRWGSATTRGVHVYGLPSGPVAFHGLDPYVAGAIAGVPGWEARIELPLGLRRANVQARWSVPAGGTQVMSASMPGARRGRSWARVQATGDASNLLLAAHVEADDAVVIVARNPTTQPQGFQGNLMLECGLA